MGVKIRNYKTNDFDQVVRLLKKANLYSKEIDKKTVLERKIQHDPQSIIVAKEGDKIIGCIFSIFDPWISLIYHLTVDAKHRNKGIGRKLINEVEKRLKKRKAKALALYIHEKNKGIMGFYKKFGWFSVGRTICMGKVNKKI